MSAIRAKTPSSVSPLTTSWPSLISRRHCLVDHRPHVVPRVARRHRSGTHRRRRDSFERKTRCTVDPALRLTSLVGAEFAQFVIAAVRGGTSIFILSIPVASVPIRMFDLRPSTLYVLSEHCDSESFCVGTNAGRSPPISGLPGKLPQALQSSSCFQRWVTLTSSNCRARTSLSRGSWTAASARQSCLL